MKFCSACGAPVALGIPDGDDRERYICTNCHTVHYQNPRMVTGAIVMQGDQLLMCRRAIKPRYGAWTLPAGYMENGETIEAAACREVREEAGAELIDLEPYALFNLPFVDQLYFMFRARLKDGVYSAGEESLEVKLVELGAIPWAEMAFPVITRVLEYFIDDYRRGSFPFRVLDAPNTWLE